MSGDKIKSFSKQFGYFDEQSSISSKKKTTLTFQHTQILVAYPFGLWLVLRLAPRKPIQFGSLHSERLALDQ